MYFMILSADFKNNCVKMCFSAVSLNKLSKLIFFFSEIIALQDDDENSCVELDGLPDDNLSSSKSHGKSNLFSSECKGMKQAFYV